MRRELQLLLLINGSIILFLAYQCFDLITLLNDTSFKDVLLESELRDVIYTKTADGEIIPDRPLIIPKIIHQTYKNETIPDIWKETHQSCIDLHPDYQYILWTDESARAFIETTYPWFLPTFDSYPYPIMRADVIRYFVLSHFGGVYIDLDDGCERRLDPLLTVPAWLRKTDPTGVSNDIMGSIPKHPFFLKVLGSLEKYNHNWFISYITIMISTGPLFLSVIWKQYNRWGVPKGGEVRVLSPVDHAKHTTWFFIQAQGSSWHLGDAKFIMMMGRHWIIFFFLGTALVLSFLYVQYWLYQKLARVGVRKYRRVIWRFVCTKLGRRSEPEFNKYELVESQDYEPGNRGERFND